MSRPVELSPKFFSRSTQQTFGVFSRQLSFTRLQSFLLVFSTIFFFAPVSSPDRRGERGPARRTDRQFGWHGGCRGGRALCFPGPGGGARPGRGRRRQSSSQHRGLKPLPGGGDRGPIAGEKPILLPVKTADCLSVMSCNSHIMKSSHL